MNRKQYKDYFEAVKNTFESEGIENLSTVYSEELQEDENTFCHQCPHCGETVGPDPFFSWQSCEICKRPEGGNRYHAAGYNREKDEIYCFDVCEDCLYFAEYGQLDDMQMMDIKQPDTAPQHFDRFDICEAYYTYAMDCHGGQNTETYKIFGRLQSIGFKPAPSLCAETLNYNARAIYNRLVEKGYKGEELTDEEKENTYLYD